MEAILFFEVAIPSNRVNVSYQAYATKGEILYGRNPLKSGQCFLLTQSILSLSM